MNKVPGSSPSDADPSVGIGSNGTVYFGYVGSDGRPAVAVSHDQGSTWSTPQVLGADLGVKNAVFPSVVAGDDNRASMVYLGTTKAGDYQSQTDFKDAEWHLYLATTYDGGRTWVSTDATPHDPVQRGSICTGGTTCGNDRNLLDFIDVTTDDHGRVEVAFADGCIDACVSDPQHQGRDAYATIARQSGGKTLFGAYDPAVTNATLSSLRVTPSGNQLTATLQVENTGTKTLPSIATQVLDGRKQVGLVTTTDLAAGATKTVTVTWKPSGQATHAVTGVVDPTNAVAESDEADNKTQQTVTLR